MINDDFKSALDILKAFPNEATCLEHLTALRWNGVVTSPFDPFSKVYTCSHDRYRCRNTGKYFNAITGTIFHNSKVELQKWFIAIWIVNKNQRITSVELGRDLSITQKTAWLMLQKIKKYPNIFESEFAEVPSERLSKSEANKRIDEISVEEASDKLPMHEWLQLFKK